MSTRPLTSGQLTVTSSTEIAPILLCELSFPSAPVRVWTGFGMLTVAGVDYLGLGTLGSIEPVEETADLSARGLTVRLAGIPADVLSLALAENYQGRTGKLWLAFLNSSAQIIDSVIPIFAGRMDTLQAEDAGSTGAIIITLENNLIDLARPRERRFTHQDQQIDFPGDLGLEYVAGLQTKELYWGRSGPEAAKSPTAPTPRAFF